MKVLSGIQPTGAIHWGNYFGAIRQYIALQDNEQAFYFIANFFPGLEIGLTREARALFFTSKVHSPALRST